MIRRIVTVLLACLFAVAVHAQEIYTLERCRELALKNNAKAQNGQLSVEASEQSKKEAFTHYFPSVSAMGLGFQASSPMMEMAAEQGTMGMLEKGIIGALSVSQPVFAGGQIVNGNRLAKVGAEVAALQKSISEDELTLAVEQLYWQIIALNEKTKTIAEAENLLNRVHQDVENFCDAGLANRNDLLKVELKQHELESGKLTLTNGLNLSKMALAQLAGVAPEGFEIDTTLANEALLLHTPVDHSSALLRRTEYRLLDKSIEAGKLQVKMEIGKNLPTVALGAGWNYMHFDKGSPLASEKNSGMVFVNVSVPISGWWGGSHAIKKQKLQLKKAENDKRDAVELLLIQMQQLRNEVDEAMFRVQLSVKTIDVALENVRLNEDYYKAGTSLLSDLLDAQNALQQAHDRHTEAVTDYRVKLAKYKQGTRE
jgi:outer membrane protein TolC